MKPDMHNSIHPIFLCMNNKLHKGWVSWIKCDVKFSDADTRADRPNGRAVPRACPGPSTPRRVRAGLGVRSCLLLPFADRGGAIRVWNRGAETMFGHVAAEAIGRNHDMIIPEHVRAAHWEAFHRAMAAGRTRGEGRVATPRSMHTDGSRL